MLEIRNYIRGEWISVREGREIEVRNPADQDEVIGKGFLASRREAETAIAAAGEALPAWSRMPAPKRGEIESGRRISSAPSRTTWRGYSRERKGKRLPTPGVKSIARTMF